MSFLSKYKFHLICVMSILLAITLFFLIRTNVAKSNYKEGCRLFNEGDYLGAIEKYEKAEKWGNKQARFSLGTMLYNPYYADSAHIDYDCAEKMLTRSKMDGIDESNYHLGIMALKGLGQTPNLNKAKEFFNLYAGQETGASRYQLYLISELEGNRKAALAYLKESSEADYPLGKGIYGQYLLLNFPNKEEGLDMVNASAESKMPLINYYLWTDCLIKADQPVVSKSISKATALVAEERTLSGRPNIAERLMSSPSMISPFDIIKWGKVGMDDISNQLLRRGYKIIKNDSTGLEFMTGLKGDTIEISIMNDGNFTMGVKSFYPRSSSIFYNWMKNAKDNGMSLSRLGYLNSDLVLMEKDSCSLVFDNGTHTLRSWVKKSDLLTEDDVKDNIIQSDTTMTLIQQNGHYLYSASDAAKSVYFHNLNTGIKYKYDKPYRVLGVNDSIILLDNNRNVDWIYTPTNKTGKSEWRVLSVTDKNFYCKSENGTLSIFSRNPLSENSKPDYIVMGMKDNRVALKHESTQKLALLDCEKNTISEMPNLTVLGISGDVVACKDNTNTFVKYVLSTNKKHTGNKIFGVLDSHFICVRDSIKYENGYKHSDKIIEKYDLNGRRVSVSFPETGDGKWFYSEIDKMKFVDDKIMITLKQASRFDVGWSFAIYNPLNNTYRDITGNEYARSASFVGDNVSVEFDGNEAEDGTFDMLCPVLTYNSSGDVISRTTKRHKDTFTSKWKKMYPTNQFGEPIYSRPFIRYKGPGYTVTITQDCITINFGYSLQSVIRSVALKDSFGEVTQISYLNSTLGGDDSIDIMGKESIGAILDALDAGSGKIAVDYEGFFVDSREFFDIPSETAGVKEALRRLLWEYDNNIKAKI